MGKLSVSILSADLIHADVMDDHPVPSLTFGRVEDLPKFESMRAEIATGAD